MGKKIVITVPTLSVGGMERAVINTASQLALMGFEVVIFTLSSDEIFYDIPQGVKVVIGKKKKDKRGLFFISLFKLRLFCCNFKPDYLFSFSGMHSSYVILAVLGLKLNLYVFHRSNPYIIYGRINNFLNKILFPLASGLVVQTLEAKSFFQKKYKTENVVVFPNPIRSFDSSYLNLEREKIVLSVGRLVPSKDFGRLIRIFKKSYVEGWKLVIIGDGPLFGELSVLIEDIGMKDKIKLIGFQKNIDFYLFSSSVFAFTSKSEGFPNALLEAMCAGLACISFNCPTGPSDILIDGKNGFLVAMNDEQTYVDGLKKLMKDDDLRLKFSKEAQLLKGKHCPDKVIRDFINAIVDIG